jgi:hypothetical protein
LFLSIAALALIASWASAEVPLAKWLADALSHAQTKETKSLGEAMGGLIRSGNHEQARMAVQQAAAAERMSGNAQAGILFDRLDQELGVYIEFQKIRQSLPPDLRDVVEEFGSVALPMSRVAVVPVAAQPFLEAFRDSQPDPTAYLSQMSPAQKEEAGNWMANPKRLFLAGAGADIDLAKQIRKSYESQGYSVFFYKFCTGLGAILCEDAIVGSYFKSSTRSLVINTPAAALSAFVLPEVQMGLALAKGWKLIVMISPDQYRLVVTAQRSGIQVLQQQMTAVVLTVANDTNQQ